MAAPVGSHCPLCHVAMREKFRGIAAEETGETFQVDECPQCGLGQTRPVPADLTPYYDAGYYGKRHGPTGRICNRRRLGFVRHWAGPGMGRSLLDFGCGEGDFLRAARTQGWNGCGVERSRAASEPGDLTVVASLDELGDRTRFDCATFWHVLEHLNDPVGTLDALRDHLEPDGLVLAAVPNFGSWQAQVTGASWLPLDIPRHLFHFTAHAIVKLFAASGFQVDHIAYGEWEYDVIGWSQSLLNRGLGGRNEFFKIVSGRPNSGSLPRKAFQVVAGLGISLLTAGPAWGESRLGRGGTLIAVARPVKTWASGHA
ncbi:class I SAM-dependent methyltransferase [Singulisphaera sp. Ch08]|uniref:Class I SAM-dependent methyltransferase n=1 Tax=Singulisphaera sp. Ch08 TaxID=3120278 RepID=A0AAU7CKM4_9BACT